MTTDFEFARIVEGHGYCAMPQSNYNCWLPPEHWLKVIADVLEALTLSGFRVCDQGDATDVYARFTGTIQITKEALVQRGVANRDLQKKARPVFDKAKRLGTLTPASSCSLCGIGPEYFKWFRKTGIIQVYPTTIQGHHHDYALPLDVTWLCTICHGGVHSAINRQHPVPIPAFGPGPRGPWARLTQYPINIFDDDDL